MNIARETAIVGIGSTAQGQLPGRSANDIAAEAIQLALHDAGLTKDDVDGLITCRNLQGRACIDEQVGQLLGLNPSYSATLDYGTGNFSLHLGVMAICAGLATTVVLAYGTNQRSQRVGFGNTVGGGAEFTPPRALSTSPARLPSPSAATSISTARPNANWDTLLSHNVNGPLSTRRPSSVKRCPSTTIWPSRIWRNPCGAPI